MFSPPHRQTTGVSVNMPKTSFSACRISRPLDIGAGAQEGAEEVHRLAPDASAQRHESAPSPSDFVPASPRVQRCP